MKMTPDINPESQDVAELQAMVKALLTQQEQKESQWEQERQSLIEQFKLALERQFAKRSEALKPYDEAQGDLFNEANANHCLKTYHASVSFLTLMSRKSSALAGKVSCIKSVKTVVKS